MIEIDFIDGYRYATITKDDNVHKFLIDLVTQLLMKKMSSEDGKDVLLFERELLSIGRFPSKKDKAKDEIRLLVRLDILEDHGLRHPTSFGDAVFKPMENVYSITEKGRIIIKDLKKLDEVQLRF
jgi:hypothetical protein